MRTNKPIFWFILDILVLGISTISWAWLLRTLCKTPTSKLFLRQLRSLAIAGLLKNILQLPYDVLSFLYMPAVWGLRLKKVLYCELVYNLWHAMRFVSILQEVHLAATFLTQSVRWQTALLLLNWCIPVVWVLGCVLGILDGTILQWHYSDKEKSCVSDHFDFVTIAVICLCLAVSFLSCVVISYCTWKAVPGTVRQRSLKRAISYPVIALVSYLPTLIVYYCELGHPSLQWYYRFVDPLSYVLENSNGFLNTAAYVLQLSSRARQRGGNAVGAEPAGNVAVDSYGSQPRGVLHSIASFHVGFGDVDMGFFPEETPPVPEFQPPICAQPVLFLRDRAADVEARRTSDESLEEHGHDLPFASTTTAATTSPPSWTSEGSGLESGLEALGASGVESAEPLEADDSHEGDETLEAARARRGSWSDRVTGQREFASRSNRSSRSGRSSRSSSGSRGSRARTEARHPEGQTGLEGAAPLGGSTEADSRSLYAAPFRNPGRQGPPLPVQADPRNLIRSRSSERRLLASRSY